MAQFVDQHGHEDGDHQINNSISVGANDPHHGDPEERMHPDRNAEKGKDQIAAAPRGFANQHGGGTPKTWGTALRRFPAAGLFTAPNRAFYQMAPAVGTAAGAVRRQRPWTAPFALGSSG